MNLDKYKYLKNNIDLNNLTLKQTNELCGEIRDFLINEVSKTGGHLSSNLGVVEATVALHRVFDSSKDRFVFDVGHQCYTHKILTDRIDRFDTLRKKDGLSGFTKMYESRHDAFGAGHSSTSISAALGIATALKLAHEDDFTIAFLGDGAMTGGLSYEGLNNAGRSGANLLIVLNDNELSISKNVGALAKYFSGLRASQGYFALKDFSVKVLMNIPIIGKPILAFLRWAKKKFKSSLNMQNTNFFEDFGFEYYGTVDGHNIKKMEPIFKRVKSRGRPAVVHIKTKKGYGYSLAEENPTLYHGVSDFDINDGVNEKDSKKSYSYEFGSYLYEKARDDSRICAITAAMTDGVGLTKFAKTYNNRFFDVGIAEGHAVTFASGLASIGYKPVFACYSTFLQRAFDNILHDAALQNLPIVLAIDRAGFVGEDGETHQGIFDVAMLSAIPNTEIYAPISFKQLRHCIDLVLKNNKLSCIRYPRGCEVVIDSPIVNSNESIAFDDCDDADVILISYGRTVKELVAAKKLIDNKKVGIISLLKIKPIDIDAIRNIIGTCKNILFVEEGILKGGIGQQLASIIPCKCIGIDDTFVKQGTVEEQYKMYDLDGQSIAEYVNNEFYDKN